MMIRRKALLISFVALTLLGAVHVGRAAPPGPAKITAVRLDRDTVSLACPVGQTAKGEACNDSLMVRVKAELDGPLPQGSQLQATVSGGRARRVNSLEFDWDVAGVYQGTYTVTLGIVDQEGRYGEARTATLNVKRCDCGYFDSCATVAVTATTASVRPGETITFVASVVGGSAEVTYNWTISAGTITKGQGTPAIEVETDLSMRGLPVTATLEINDPNATLQCPTTASETVSVLNLDDPRKARMGDEFRTAGSNCEEGFARLDNFMVELANDPTASGAIILYAETSDPRSAYRRKKQLMSFIGQRHFDRTRITFIDGPLRDNATTQFWLVPAGAEMPAPDPGPMPDLHVNERPSKPYLFGAEYADGIPGCDGREFDVAAFASEILATGARGRVVISESSSTRFARKRREIVSELKKNSVALGRVTFALTKVHPNQLAESVELWIIPKK